MSDRALAYSDEPLRHRHLVIYEAAGMAGDFATYLIRTLLSEGRLRYETSRKRTMASFPSDRAGGADRPDRHHDRRAPAPGERNPDADPDHHRHQEQTAAVFKALAQEGTRADLDLSRWHALQTWLSTGPTQVTIPYAEKLADLVPPIAVRLRRDFKTVLMLIQAHALLHQASRHKDEQDRIIADRRGLRGGPRSRRRSGRGGRRGHGSPEIREVVEAVATLVRQGTTEVKIGDLATALKLDKSAVSRRVSGAVDAGVLRNLEDRKGCPHRLILGESLPGNVEVLPPPEVLQCCNVDEGVKEPPPPTFCDFCGEGGRADDPLLTSYDGEASALLHRSCWPSWAAAAGR